MQIGYARVSTLQQDTALQVAAFARAGVTRVLEEKRSAKAARPVLDALLTSLQPGDCVVVYKMDRLARSLVDLLRILERIEAAGASFRSLTEPLETSTPIGRMLLQLLGAIAEFERSLIRERCTAGRIEAERRGVVMGRPVLVSRPAVLQLRAQGLTRREICAQLGCSLTAVSVALRGVRQCDGGPGLTHHLAARAVSLEARRSSPSSSIAAAGGAAERGAASPPGGRVRDRSAA